MLRDKFAKRALGLEFRDDSLVVTCLKKSLSGIELVSSATIQFDGNAEEHTLSELRKFIARHGAGAETVSVAIPSGWALVKFLDIPSLERDDLGRLMGYEVEKHVPFSPEEVYYDFHVLGKNGNSYKIVLVAVQREKVGRLKEFLLKIPLEPKIVNISSLCALNTVGSNGQKPHSIRNFQAFERHPEVSGKQGEVSVFLLMGRKRCEMSVIRGGSCIYLKNITLGMDGPPEPLWEKLSSEIDATLSWLFIKRFERLILSGHGSYVVAGHAAKRPDLKVTVAKRPEGTSAAGTSDNELLPSIGAGLAGLGLGSTRINVLPDKSTAKKTGPLVSVASLCVIFILLAGLAISGITNDKRHLWMIEEKIRTNGPEMAEAERLASRLDMAERQKRLLLGARYKSAGKLEMLSELSGIIPADTWLTHLKYKEDSDAEGGSGGELVIQGFAGSSSKLISLLEDSPLFENVAFDGPINKSELGEGFKIKATVRNNG